MRKVATSDGAIRTPWYRITLSSAPMRIRSTPCVHRSMSGTSSCLGRRRGVRGLICRPTVAVVLGREIRGRGVGTLQAIIVSVDTRDTCRLICPRCPCHLVGIQQVLITNLNTVSSHFVGY